MITMLQTEDEYQAAMAELWDLWGADKGTPEGERLDFLFALCFAYEQEHFPMPPN